MRKCLKAFKLKRNYDIEALARSNRFSARDLEKICRISDILEDLSAIRFLRDRLSLYGGTALAFIYYDEILRLSIDIDFNYRHQEEREWGEVRKEIDQRTKALLYQQGYKQNNIAIDASYPLARFTIYYRSMQNLRDSFKIEIGYMQRYPILREDTMADFRHLGIQETFPIKSPQREELFANKWCALLFRSTPRDFFDIHQIVSMKMDSDIFRKCAVVDSFMQRQGKHKLYEIEINQVISQIRIDSSLRNLLLIGRAFNFNEMKEEVIRFSESIMADLTKNEIRAIDQFFDAKRFEPKLIDEDGIFHEKLREHPSIQRALSQLK